MVGSGIGIQPIGANTMIKIVIKTDNAAFEDENYGVEAARILREMAAVLENGGHGNGTVNFRDINGNNVATLNA